MQKSLLPKTLLPYANIEGRCQGKCNFCVCYIISGCSEAKEEHLGEVEEAARKVGAETLGGDQYI